MDNEEDNVVTFPKEKRSKDHTYIPNKVLDYLIRLDGISDFEYRLAFIVSCSMFDAVREAQSFTVSELAEKTNTTKNKVLFSAKKLAKKDILILSGKLTEPDITFNLDIIDQD